MRVADIPWSESEGVVIFLPERRARPRSIKAWHHRELREPNFEEQVDVMVVAEACEALESRRMPVLLINPEGTVMYADVFERLGRAHRLGKPTYVQRVAGLEDMRSGACAGLCFLSSSNVGFIPASIISGAAHTWYCRWFDNVKGGSATVIGTSSMCCGYCE